MSDTVLVAIIAGTPGVLSALLGFVNNALVRRATELAKKNEQHLADTKTAMQTLEKNTNSIKDELIKVTAEASRAKGNLEGRAEQKAERGGGAEEHSG